MTSYQTIDANEIFQLQYSEKVVQPGFCIGKGPNIVFTKNETMICGLKNIGMEEDCLEYEFVNPGYFVNGTLILPCKSIINLDQIVMGPPLESGSNYQSPNFNVLFISMMLLFIFYLKR
ncbi:hypothetical protein EDC94DRAFT_698646 [Helicostylum pulchrum]|nr:hypothetical protein EDC94DRAFT_698646 [Helicostylum pulchrum]